MATDTDLRFIDSADNVRVIITAAAYAEMQSLAAATAPMETGGVLIGVYNKEEAVVVRYASAPPLGSRATRTSFLRGTGGLLALLEQRWRHGEYYVGEWHAHPCAVPGPSATDFCSLEAIAREESLNCAAPILVILGDGRRGPVASAHVRWPDGLIETMRERGSGHQHIIERATT